MSDSFLADAGWLFFAVWSGIIMVISITAFGRDLLSFRSQLGSVLKTSPPIDNPTNHSNVRWFSKFFISE